MKHAQAKSSKPSTDDQISYIQELIIETKKNLREGGNPAYDGGDTKMGFKLPDIVPSEDELRMLYNTYDKAAKAIKMWRERQYKTVSPDEWIRIKTERGRRSRETEKIYRKKWIGEFIH